MTRRRLTGASLSRNAGKLEHFDRYLLSSRRVTLRAATLTTCAWLGMCTGPASAQEVGAEPRAAEPATANVTIVEIDETRAGPAPLSLSFAEAIELGFQNNVRTQFSEQQVQTAKANRVRSLSGLLPNASGQVSQLRRTANLLSVGIDPSVLPDVPAVFGPFNTFDARIQLAQAIFDLTAIGTARAGAAALKRSEIKLTLAEHLVFKKTGETYVKVLKFQGQVEANKQDLELAKTLLADTTTAFDSGVATAVDKARAESRMLASETRLYQAQTALTQATYELKALLLLPMRTPIALTSELRPEPTTTPNAQEALITALTHRPDIKFASEEIRVAGYKHRAAVGQQVPSIGFAVSYAGNGNTPGENVEGVYQLAGILQIPLFDGGNTIGLIKAARSKMREAEIILRDLQEQADKDVNDALTSLRYTALEMVSTATRVEVSKQELKLAQDRFFNGVSDNLEVVSAQTTLSAARNAYVQALAKYSDARISLAVALGTIDDFDF